MQDCSAAGLPLWSTLWLNTLPNMRACWQLQAQRAEVDSGLLVDELQALIRAKSDAAQERADLDR